MKSWKDQLENFRKLSDELNSNFQKFLDQEFERLEQKERSIDLKIKKFEEIERKLHDDNEVIIFDVGGQIFKTTMFTIKKADPSSLFAAIASGKHELKKNIEGYHVFLDRNPAAFSVLLNYIREKNLVIPKDLLERKKLLEEARFYQLESAVKFLEIPAAATETPTMTRVTELPKVVEVIRYVEVPVFKVVPFEGSSILNEEQMNQLSSMVDEKVILKWRLIFKATRDGKTATSFHKHCDGTSPTVTIVKSSSNIFGGYTSERWNHENHSGNFRTDKSAFLFTLANPFNSIKKIPINAGKEAWAIWCGHPSGPHFGGSDMYLMNRDKDYYNLNSFYYDANPGLFTGKSGYFVSDEIEVFTMH